MRRKKGILCALTTSFFWALLLPGAARADLVLQKVAGMMNDGNNVPAAQLVLNQPIGVAVDDAGNFYIADRDNHVVRKVSAAGIGMVVAGNYTNGFSGDGGPATAAQLSYPEAVAVDGSGNVFIADTNNNRVRKVSAAGVISTVAGDGTTTFSGDGGPATAASLFGPSGVYVYENLLYIADTYHNRIRKVSGDGTITTVAGGGASGLGDEGPATSAQLNRPFGMCLDKGRTILYIADTQNNRIRQVDAGGVITTIVNGAGTAGDGGDGGAPKDALINNPRSVAVDADDYLYIADDNNHRIRKVSVGSTITTWAGDGTYGYGGDGGDAIKAYLAHPTGVACAPDGSLIIADISNDRIRRVSSGGIISTAAGCGLDDGGGGYTGDDEPAVTSGLYWPEGLTFDNSSNLYIADSYNNRIRMVDPDGKISTYAGTGTGGDTGDGGLADVAQLDYPTGVTWTAARNLYIADSSNHKIRMVDDKYKIETVAGRGTYGFSGDGGKAIDAELYAPTGTAVDGQGNIYIADRVNHRIRKVSAASGNIETIAGDGTEGFLGDGGSATDARLSYPYAVALDGLGALYILDYGNDRVRKVVLASGTINTVAGGGTPVDEIGDNGPATQAKLKDPLGFVLDGAGNIYIADSYNFRIRKVNSQGIITTIAGVGEYGFSKDGTLALSAKLGTPLGLAFASDGSLYVSEYDNHIVRRLVEACADRDGDGHDGLADNCTTGTDCDDADDTINPGMAETCNGLDENCDGQIDEGALITYYQDSDADGYGKAVASTQACAAPAGYVTDSTDCDDMDASLHDNCTSCTVSLKPAKVSRLFSMLLPLRRIVITSEGSAVFPENPEVTWSGDGIETLSVKRKNETTLIVWIRIKPRLLEAAYSVTAGNCSGTLSVRGF